MFSAASCEQEYREDQAEIARDFRSKYRKAPKILNLYSGIGGNRKKWTPLGNEYQVHCVEKNDKIKQVYMRNFLQDICVGDDSMDVLLNNHQDYDFIWSSPPCQSHSRMMKATRHDVRKFPDMTLYQQIIFLQHFYKGYWVVENVKPYYEPLIKPTAIIGRHYFWSNFEIDENIEPPKFKNFMNAGTVKETDKLKEWLGIYYDGNIYYEGNHCPGQVLRNAVHPDIGLHILKCFENAKK